MLLSISNHTTRFGFILSLLLSLTFVPLVHAQEDVIGPTEFARNSIFVELGGNGILYSLNYDRKFANHVSGRIGGMFATLKDENTDERIGLLLLPTMVNYLIGSGSSRIELGLGPLWGYANGELDDVGSFSGFGLAGVTSTVGYRLQPVDGGFNFRIALTPFATSDGFQLWGGLGFGFSF